MTRRRGPNRGLHGWVWLAVPLAVASVVVGGQPSAARQGDRDGDGLRDRFEERGGVTDPDRPDTDQDGIWDGHEDADGDRLSNLGEQLFGTDPSDPDSDHDGIRDGADDADGNGRMDALEQDRRPVPSGITPSLSQAFWDVPSSYSNGCHSGGFSATIHPCIYGSKKGRVRVAIFGDSHALQWLPALDKVGKKHGWRVTTLTKTACPSVDVAFEESDYSDAASCDAWRSAGQRWLRKNRQDVVIITNSGRYPLVDAEGQRQFGSRKEPQWQAGLARVIETLPKRTVVIVLADTPHLGRNPVSCLQQGVKVISDCVSRRSQSLLPEHDEAERETAESHGAIFGQLNHVICPYSPCPIVNGDTLMWRNESHLTATYARQLAPAVRRLVEHALAASGAGLASSEPAETAIEIIAYDDRYEPDTVVAAPGSKLIVSLTNRGNEKHGITFYMSEGGVPLTEDSIGPLVDPGMSATVAIVVPEAGEYLFLDDDNPSRLRGTLIVREAEDT